MQYISYNRFISPYKLTFKLVTTSFVSFVCHTIESSTNSVVTTVSLIKGN